MANILLVEDDLDISVALSTLLREEGHRVVAAFDGTEALALLREGERPALILLDLMMSDMNGAEFRAAQLSDPALAGIPVVILSADRRLREKATALGAAAAFEKPLEVPLLLETILRVADTSGPAHASTITSA